MGICCPPREWSGKWGVARGEEEEEPDGSRIVKGILCLTLISFSPLNTRSPCPSVRSPARSLVLQSLTCPFLFPVPEVLLDPCRTWCPASTCQAVCQLQETGLQTPQLVQCQACDAEFCSACKASWHPGQGCPETMPITFLPGETRYARGTDRRPGEGISLLPQCASGEDRPAARSVSTYALLLGLIQTWICLFVYYSLSRTDYVPGTVPASGNRKMRKEQSTLCPSSKANV